MPQIKLKKLNFIKELDDKLHNFITKTDKNRIK